VYSRIISSGFYIGQGNIGGPKGPKKETITMPNREPDAVHKDFISKGHALLYRLSGDYNPLHADNNVARKMGFPSAILHGLCTYNHAAHAVLRHFGGSDPDNFKSLSARFTSPVLPGQTLEHRMWKVGEKDGYSEIRFASFVDNKQVLGNGRSYVKAGTKSRL